MNHAATACVLGRRGMIPLVGFSCESAADGRDVSLGQEVHHQPIEVVWAFQWQHV
jgi:hypothetical protein